MAGWEGSQAGMERLYRCTVGGPSWEAVPITNGAWEEGGHVGGGYIQVLAEASWNNSRSDKSERWNSGL